MRQSDPMTLEPHDLDFLQTYFDTVRRKRGIETDSHAANDLAAQIMELYKVGFRNHAELDHRLCP